MALAVTGEAASLMGFHQVAPPLGLGSAFLPVVVALLVAVISAASVATSGSLTVGLAVALMPLSVASGWVGFLTALAATSSSLITAGISFLALRLRRHLGDNVLSTRRPMVIPPSPTALAASSLALYLLWAFRAPIISGFLVGQAIYAGAAASAAVAASLSSSDILRGVVKGVMASLGPLGLAVIAAVNGLEADEAVRLF